MSEKVLQELEKRRDELRVFISHSSDELQKVENAIAALLGTSATRTNWTDGALNCIASKNQVLQTTEILECLVSSEDLEDYKKARNYTIALSNALNNMVANGTLRKVIVKGQKGHFYGLPEWFKDENGNSRLIGEYGVKLTLKTMKPSWSTVRYSDSLELLVSK